jgi:hypothetical protein
MQSINFTGGISDILKNKTSKGKPKNKKMEFGSTVFKAQFSLRRIYPFTPNSN